MLIKQLFRGRYCTEIYCVLIFNFEYNLNRYANVWKYVLFKNWFIHFVLFNYYFPFKVLFFMQKKLLFVSFNFDQTFIVNYYAPLKRTHFSTIYFASFAFNLIQFNSIQLIGYFFSFFQFFLLFSYTLHCRYFIVTIRIEIRAADSICACIIKINKIHLKI